MIILKQSTASQSVLIGPFVDSTDGVTAETALTIANTDIRMSKAGGNMAAKNSGGGTHDEAGWYTITFDATDTNTAGSLQVSVAMSGALPVFAEFQVIEEAVYDALYASGATGPNQTTPLDAAGVRTAVGLASANLDTQLGDVPTVSEFNARTIASANYLTSSDLPANFADLAITVTTGQVTVGTNNDKTGYTLSAAGVDAIQTDVETTLESYGLDETNATVNLIVADTNELQTSQGNWLTATGFSTHSPAAVADAVWTEAIADHSDTVGSTAEALNNAGGGLTVAAIADAVWDELLSGHTIVGSTGAGLSAAGASGDPWATALPGAYAAGTAGKIIADTQTAADNAVTLLGTTVDARSPFAPGDEIPAYQHDALTYSFTVATDYTSGYTAKVLIQTANAATVYARYDGTIASATSITFDYDYSTFSEAPTFSTGGGKAVASLRYVLVITETASGNDVVIQEGSFPVYARGTTSA